jgi:hypothetical protein
MIREHGEQNDLLKSDRSMPSLKRLDTLDKYEPPDEHTEQNPSPSNYNREGLWVYNKAIGSTVDAVVQHNPSGLYIRLTACCHHHVDIYQGEAS